MSSGKLTWELLRRAAEQRGSSEHSQINTGDGVCWHEDLEVPAQAKLQGKGGATIVQPGPTEQGWSRQAWESLLCIILVNNCCFPLDPASFA